MSDTTRLATRYACRYDGNESAGMLHTRGNGKPTRKACRYCRGPLDVRTGLWGAFHWVPSARYSDYAEDRALVTFTSEAKADAYAAGLYAADSNSDVVIRWVDKSEA